MDIKISFKINMLLDDTIEDLKYSLTSNETENLLSIVDKDFLNIAKDEDVTLRFDVLLEDKDTITNIIQVLSDMFPTSIGNGKSKKNIEKFIIENKQSHTDKKDEVIIELDKIFMIYYAFLSKKDSSNITRNIQRKMRKYGVTTINGIPLIKRIALSDLQLIDIQKNAMNKPKLTDNFFILDVEKIPKEKWTIQSTDYYILLYRERLDFVQNEKNYYYVLIKSKEKNVDYFIKEYTDLSVSEDNLRRCKLFEDLSNYSENLKWEHILGLLNNLKDVKIKLKDTGKLATTYIIEHLKGTQKELCKILIKFMRANESCEKECKEFCPYANTCHHAKTMLSTVHIKKDEIVKIDKEEDYITVEQARKKLSQKAEKLYNNLLSKKINMALLIAQTGLGKTEKVIELIIRTIQNGISCIYAVPNRKTIREFKKRHKEKGFNQYIITPTLEGIQDEKIAKEIKYLQDIGAYTRLRFYLTKLLEKDKSLKKKLLKKDKKIINEYLEKNEKIKTFKGLIITTHSRFPYFDEKFYNKKIAFVDEDIFDSDFIRTKTIILSKLRATIEDSIYLMELQALEKLDKIEDMKENIVTPIYSITIDNNTKQHIERELKDMRKYPINVFEFLSCTAVKKYYDGYKYKIKIFNFSEMPKIPVFITSATAEDEFYEAVYENERKKQTEIVSKARYKGKIILWDSHTYSQQFMSKEENLEYITDLIEMCRIGNMNLVTFKKFIQNNRTLLIDDETTNEPKLLDGINCYNFFSLLGIDELKNNDLAVIGKPLKDDDIFYFLAKLVYNRRYGDTEQENQKCRTQIVEDKGFLFNLFTYDDETLRKIQMWSISSNEEQYVGRARVINNENRTVYLASGYPVEQMQFRDDEEEDKE